MLRNPVIEAMLNRKSIRKYKDDMPPDEVIETVVRAGMQAPFAGQIYSVLLSRGREKTPWGAPLEFVVCVDTHKLEAIMARRGWEMVANNLMVLLFGFQDAVLMAENMVIAAESLGLGSCFIGLSPAWIGKIAKRYKLPKRVFPVVMLVMGYPDEDRPPRPRYPLEYVLFEDEYPKLTDNMIANAMTIMDEGYLAQAYYRQINYMVELESGRKESFTFDDYSWTEHISRKWGQWHKSPDDLLAQLEQRGFPLPSRAGERKTG